MDKIGEAMSERLARQFHETYEKLAPQFGYRTRAESAKPWGEVPESNRQLMIAVCAEILPGIEAALLEKWKATDVDQWLHSSDDFCNHGTSYWTDLSEWRAPRYRCGKCRTEALAMARAQEYQRIRDFLEKLAWARL